MEAPKTNIFLSNDTFEAGGLSLLEFGKKISKIFDLQNTMKLSKEF